MRLGEDWGSPAEYLRGPVGLGDLPAPAGWCPHTLGQDWGEICFLVIQNCPCRAPFPLLSVSVLIGLTMLRTKPCPGRSGGLPGRQWGEWKGNSHYWLLPAGRA